MSDRKINFSVRGQTYGVEHDSRQIYGA